jgi:predicted nucleotidyltransferase
MTYLTLIDMFPVNKGDRTPKCYIENTKNKPYTDSINIKYFYQIHMTSPTPSNEALVKRNLDCVRVTLEPLGYIELAIVFGSATTGQQRPDSDLDVAVMAAKPLSAKQHKELIGLLAVASGRAIDLIDLKEVGQPLLNQIIKYGTRVLGSDDKMANLVYRNIIDQADFAPLQQRLLKERRTLWTTKSSP